MLLKNFRFICVARIFAIVCTITLAVFLFQHTYYISTAIMTLVLGLQVFDLIQYVERTNFKLSRLIAAIENEDFALRFYENRKGDSFRHLIEALNKVVTGFSHSRKEKEEAHYYLQTVLDNTPVALIVYDKSGNVDFVNKAFKELYAHENMKNIGELRQDNPSLVEMMENLGHEQTQRLRVARGNSLQNYTVKSVRFGLYGKVLTLMSLQSIHHELEEKELESWQKLMSVLTHEIMNSITPVVSLAESAAHILEPADFDQKDNALKALNTISRRGEGLLRFTQSYRSITKLPQAELKEVPLHELFESIELLFEKTMQEAGINLEVVVPDKEVRPVADRDLTEQVLINLVLNAKDAVEESARKHIRLFHRKETGRDIIMIEDSGCGISASEMEKVFIPFYTTKKQGTGIGLSMCRQLLRIQQASIRLSSKKGKGTKVEVIF